MSCQITAISTTTDENVFDMTHRLEKRERFIAKVKKEQSYRYVHQMLKNIHLAETVLSPPVTPRVDISCTKCVRERESFVWKQKIQRLYIMFTTPVKLDLSTDLYI